MTTKPSIYIAVPAFGGMIHAEFAQCLFGLCQRFAALQIPGTADILCGASNIAYARTTLANRFLKSSFSHLLFLDADLVFTADDVLKMIQAQKQVIALPYSRKAINWQTIQQAVKAGAQPDLISQIASDLVVNLCETNHQQLKLDQPTQVKAIGCGVMLIAKEVFTKLSTSHPEWRCRIRLHDHEQEQPGFAFFNSVIDDETGNLMSEDYSFCYEWRKVGGQVFMLPSAITTHIGQQKFVCNLAAMKALEQAVAPIR